MGRNPSRNPPGEGESVSRACLDERAEGRIGDRQRNKLRMKRKEKDSLPVSMGETGDRELKCSEGMRAPMDSRRVDREGETLGEVRIGVAG